MKELIYFIPKDDFNHKTQDGCDLDLLKKTC